MRARSTSAADRLRERAIEASCARSASSNINCAFGRPVTIGYLHVTRYPKCKQTMCYEFMGHYTSGSMHYEQYGRRRAILGDEPPLPLPGKCIRPRKSIKQTTAAHQLRKN